MSTQTNEPRDIKYGGALVQEFKQTAKHIHAADGGHSECWGDGKRVLRLIHRSRRNQEPRAYILAPGSLNEYGEPFVYSDYFLPEELKAARS